jgi:hypothetical protein
MNRIKSWKNAGWISMRIKLYYKLLKKQIEGQPDFLNSVQAFTENRPIWPTVNAVGFFLTILAIDIIITCCWFGSGSRMSSKLFRLMMENNSRFC